MESDQHSEKPPSALNAAIDERIENLIRGDRRLTVREIAAKAEISEDPVFAILCNVLNMY